MRAPLAAALALLLVFPAPPALSSTEPGTVYERIVADIVARLGSVPPTAVFNGVEVPAEEALAWFRANDAPLPQGEGLYLPPDDVGLGVHGAGGGCAVGALVTAYAFGYAPGLEALVDEEVQPGLEPAGILRCGSVAIPYFRGVAGARVAETAGFSSACVSASPEGYWLKNGARCYSDVAAANVAHNVGFVDIRLCFFICFRSEQMFGGVQHSAPASLPAGGALLGTDPAVITVQDA